MYRERVEGVLEAARAGGLPDDAVTMYEVGLNSRDSGRVAAGKLLDGEHPPTAIVCLSDQMAFGVLDALAERGLSAPEICRSPASMMSPPRPRTG